MKINNQNIFFFEKEVYYFSEMINLQALIFNDSHIKRGNKRTTKKTEKEQKNITTWTHKSDY